jgi:antitoxin component of RelBE/YafQ-DinJ toxin-antitoxin module
MKKSDRIFIRIDPALKAEAQAAADRQGRTLSGLIAWLLMQYIESLKKS